MAGLNATSIFNNLSNALSNTSFVTITYIRDGEIFKAISLSSPRDEDSLNNLSVRKIPIQTKKLEELDALTVIQVEETHKAFPELAQVANDVNCNKFATIPVRDENVIYGFVWLGEVEKGTLNKPALSAYTSIVALVSTAISQAFNFNGAKDKIEKFKKLLEIQQVIDNTSDLYSLSAGIHELTQRFIGDFSFILALYDDKTKSIRIPYIYDEEKNESIDTFPLGEGITSILIRTQQPLIITTDTEKHMEELGAKIVGSSAKSWMGVPLIDNNQAIGAIIVQDLHHEEAFDNDDLNTLALIAEGTTSSVQKARAHEELQTHLSQMQTASEIARNISMALDLEDLLQIAVQLIRTQFNYYHAAVFLIDSSGQYARIREATGEAGAQMKREGHKLAVGSKSIVGYASGKGEALIVGDVTKDATHRPNPFLPDTRAEAGIPIKIGDRILGVLDIQSTNPFAFGPEHIRTLQILADQLAIAFNNSELLAETQEHLSQLRLLYHITTSAASGTTVAEALSSAVKGLQVTLGGDRVLIMLSDVERENLIVKAWLGYSDEVANFVTPFGSGITGWAAAHKETLRINDVSQDTRYMEISPNTRSEMAVPLIFRNDVLGVLNVENEQISAYNDRDEEMLGTLAGSLAAIIANAHLVEQIRKQVERERMLYEVSSKIRRSTDIQTILTTTTRELSRITGAKRAQIEIGIEPDILEENQ
jgi:GAF domain-containing protein